MKKLVTLCLFLALCATVRADKLTILTAGPGIPGVDQPQLIGMGISPDGKYVCGSIEIGAGYFVGEVGADEVMWAIGDSEEEGNQLRNVDNNGLAIGFTTAGILFSIDGELTTLDTPEGDYRYVLGEDLTNDGSMIVGSLIGKGYTSKAAYKKDGEDWKLLPFPTAAEIGNLAVRDDDSSAKAVSGDGKVILGHLGSFTLPIVWVMNDNGEYEVDFFPARYLKETEDDDRILYGMSAMYQSLSNNGRYICMRGEVMDDDDNEAWIVCVYDVVEKKMTYYPWQQTVDSGGLGLYPITICDDASFAGTIGLPLFGCAGSFIMEAGQTQAKTFCDAFPEYAKVFETAEYYGYGCPADMSADGRYILGYAYYADDYLDEASNAYYTTYVIDRNGDAGGIEATVVDTQAVPEAYYTIDGKRLGAAAKGLNIVRMSDGTVRKVIKH